MYNALLHRNTLRLPTLLLSLVASALVTAQALAYEIDIDATIHDSSASLIGVNSIGLSVRDLDAALAFYQEGSGYKLIRREVVKNSSAADRLFGRDSIEYEIAVLEAPNMLFELIEFSHNRNVPISNMPVEGPGMTHTCFQSSDARSGYDRFKRAGVEMLSRGEGPVDLLGQGVTYAYGHDPEGNMIELEQLNETLMSADAQKTAWLEQGYDMWMTQVALVTHDIERLANFYSGVLGFDPYRESYIENRPTFDDATDVDGVEIKVMFFRMAERIKSMEFWQYDNPQTLPYAGNRDSTAPGYSFSIEVGDIQAEYARMSGLGVEFVSEPVLMGDHWQVYANDIDGNVFSLRQWVDPNSPWSVPNLEL